MDHLPGILLAYSAFLLSILSPGPNILAILGTSMAVGRREGTALALGVSSGSVCWAVLTAIGLSALLASYAAALTIIKIGGGCFLLWLAFKAFRSAASVHDLEATGTVDAPMTARAYFVRGLVVQMTNPKAALAWIAIIALGLRPDAPLWVAAAIVGGTGFFSFAVHIAYARLFSSPPAVRFYGRARRMIQGVLGAFFAFAGIKLLTSRL